MSGLAHKAAHAAKEMTTAAGLARAVPGLAPERMLEGAL